jgi:hypothetical protein
MSWNFTSWPRRQTVSYTIVRLVHVDEDANKFVFALERLGGCQREACDAVERRKFCPPAC